MTELAGIPHQQLGTISRQQLLLDERLKQYSQSYTQQQRHSDSNAFFALPSVSQSGTSDYATDTPLTHREARKLKLIQERVIEGRAMSLAVASHYDQLQNFVGSSLSSPSPGSLATATHYYTEQMGKHME